MYNRESLVRDLGELGLNCVPDKKYGRGSVIRLGVTPEYYLYTTVSNIDDCFWNLTRNVLNNLINDGKDFATLFMDVKKDTVYVYDKQDIKKLMEVASYDKESENYKIVEGNLKNPISSENFYEFLSSIV